MILALPVQPLRCDNPDCTLPQEGRCARLAEFPDPQTQCPNLVRQAPSETASASEVEPNASLALEQPTLSPDTAAISWSGRHMTWSGVGQMLRRTPARIVAVLGPTGAGKTCLLTSFFLQLAGGQRRDLPYRFASSKTLYGWQMLCNRAAQWDGDKKKEIVQHTPTEESKQSGNLLHLGLRPDSDSGHRIVDVLLSDIPGEWVMSLAEHDTEEHRRKLEFLEHSHAVLVLLDIGALPGEDGPNLASDTGLLLRRLLKLYKKTMKGMLSSVILVLTKQDELPANFNVPDGLSERIDANRWDERVRGPMRSVLSALREFRDEGVTIDICPVSAFPKPLHAGQPEGVMAPFVAALGHIDQRTSHRLPWRVPQGRTIHSFLTLHREQERP